MLTRTRPLAEIEPLGRKRIQRRLVESRELRRPRAFSLTERPLVLRSRNSQQHARLDPGIVARLAGTRWNHTHAVVHGQARKSAAPPLVSIYPENPVPSVYATLACRLYDR